MLNIPVSVGFRLPAAPNNTRICNSESVAITNGPAISRGTYVGTTRSNSSSQLSWIFGASGTAPWFGVWNMYNRVDVRTTWSEGTGSWTYNSATVRALHNTAVARVSFVYGLVEDGVLAIAQTYIDTNSGSTANFGWALDSTTTNTTSMQATAPSVAGIGSVQYAGLPGPGFHKRKKWPGVGRIPPTARPAYPQSRSAGGCEGVTINGLKATLIEGHKTKPGPIETRRHNPAPFNSDDELFARYICIYRLVVLRP